MKDLFGVEPLITEKNPGDKDRRYRNARGYAAPPGTGPAGETCRSCIHAYLHHSSGSKNWYKCDLVKPTRGAATDLRLKWAACSRWGKRNDLAGSDGR